jgi:hypothetical protein
MTRGSRIYHIPPGIPAISYEGKPRVLQMKLEMQALNVKAQPTRRNVFNPGILSAASRRSVAPSAGNGRVRFSPKNRTLTKIDRPSAIRIHHKSAIVRSAPSLGLPE